MSSQEKLGKRYSYHVHQQLKSRNLALLRELCKRVDESFAPKADTRKLRIAYIMNHALVRGGVKILLEHTNHLVDRGHQVVIMCRDPKPDWREVKADYIQVPPQMDFLQKMPDVDVIVCTVADQWVECYTMQKAPVILFEQGDTYIYEFEQFPVGDQQHIRNLWNTPVPIIGVSKVLMDTLDQHFGRRGHILHNALDEQYFYPRSQHAGNGAKPRILFVGMESNEFKGIRDIRQALALVRESGRDFDEMWVTQEAPSTPFDGTLLVDPDQKRLGDAYRSADLFVSGSYYESFPLPPLEAMTCGCAVVSTDNAGVQEYAVDGVNCLLGHVGNPQSLAERIIELIDDQDKRRQLVENGYRTAERFRWGKIIPQWEQYLYGAIDTWQEQQRLQPAPSLRLEMLPSGLSHQEARHRIDQVQQQMEEDWCLYGIEGETVDDSLIEQIKRVLACGNDASYAVQVLYPDDVPDHPIMRVERRLLKRGELLTESAHRQIVLSVQIKGAKESYFLDQWLAEVRDLYRNQRYEELVSLVRANYAKITPEGRLVATKWLILGLLELDRMSDVVQLVNQAIGLDNTYSDILYLSARCCMMLDRQDVSRQLLETAQQIDSATHYPETFVGIRELCEMYL